MVGLGGVEPMPVLVDQKAIVNLQSTQHFSWKCHMQNVAGLRGQEICVDFSTTIVRHPPQLCLKTRNG